MFGLEPKTLGTYPGDRRAACLIAPLPFYWLGEVLMEFPSHPPSKDTGSHEGVFNSPEWDDAMHAMLELVQSRYVLLSTVLSYGWQVFEGGDRALLAHEMLDMAERDDLPGRNRIAMAGRLIERASRVPGRVAFYGL